MAIAKTVQVLNDMLADGVIGRYAIAGAVAAYNYIEPTLTEDLDVLVAFAGMSDQKTPGLMTLEPIFAYLAKRGYVEHRKEGLLIEGWQVQFLPASKYLVANCVSVGRPKDLIRIMQFLTENAVDISALCSIISRHGLASDWQEFCAKMHIANPCDVAHSR